MSKSSGLRLLSWNADGVRGKIHELLDFATRGVSVDIVALCETRLTNHISLPTPGFFCYRQDKHFSGRGQGVALLVRKDLTHSLLSLPKTTNIEAVGIRTYLSGIEHVIISVYQSPNLPLLQTDLDLLLRVAPRVLIAGDFNANHSYWHSSYTNTRGRTLFRHMLNNDYSIHVPDIPTQVNYSAEHNPTNPDLVLCSNIKHISDPLAYIALSSNHYPLFLTIGGLVDRIAKEKYFRYQQTNWKTYRTLLDENIFLTSLTFKTNNEIDLGVNDLQSIISKARDSSVPLGTHSCDMSTLPSPIRRLIRYKNYLRRVDHSLPKGHHKTYIRQTINNICNLIKTNIRKHLDDMWNKKLSRVDNPSSDVWKLCKTIKPKACEIPPLKCPDGCLTTNVAQQCDALAAAFYENMSLTLNLPSDDLNSNIQESLAKINDHHIAELQHPVRPAEIRETLSCLKTRKSAGDDGIHNLLLKNLSQKAVVYLTKILNGCLYLGYFPSSWKTAKVIALKKPGKDGTLPINYRPISLLPSLAKLFEKLIYTRLQSVSKSRLINEQFGFRPSHSTTQQLARVSEHISHHLNLNESTGMFLLDIEKAFDTVWHAGLLHKLVKLELPISMVKLIQSYLRNRKFMVHIGNVKSSIQTVPAGVPQGSILGPYLFLLFLNDIPIQPRTHLACFADDTASYSSSSDLDLIVGRLQFSVDLLHSYFTKWKLKLNETKTEAIIFTRHRSVPKTTLKIGGHCIPWNKSVRYLGITMDNKLNWSKHIAHLRIKGAQALGALSPILNRKSNLSSDTKLKIYTTLVRPCITYACPVWSNTCLTNYQILQTIQNKALKIAYNTSFKTNLINLHKNISYPLIISFILKLSRKFFTRNKEHNSNPLISNICITQISDIKYIDRYGTYRLPHHYLLFPPLGPAGNVNHSSAHAHDQSYDTRRSGDAPSVTHT